MVKRNKIKVQPYPNINQFKDKADIKKRKLYSRQTLNGNIL